MFIAWKRGLIKTMLKFRLHDFTTDYKRQADRVLDEDIRQKYGLEKVYRLSQNENPLGPSPKAIEAIAEVAPTLSYYPSFSDIRLREAIVEAVGQGLSPEHIYTGCSGFEALEMLSRSFIAPDDEVILSSPTFISAYKKTSTLAGAIMVDVPLDPETFAYDVDGVLAGINDKTKMILLCNPNNPTGTIITAAQMDKLMTHVPEHVLVVADEVYHHFVDAPDYPVSMQYVLAGKNIVIVHSFSKAYGLAGLRLGYGIARPEIANYVSSLHRGFHQNKLSLAAGQAAALDQDYLRYAVDYLKGEMKWLIGEFDRLSVKYWSPAANFVLFETQLPAQELTEKLTHYGILVRPQHQGGLPYAIRVCIGTREANEVFIKALEAILK
jgi:histidinol-phosphate aminotransferase